MPRRAKVPDLSAPPPARNPRADDVAKLRERAKKAGAESKTKITLTLTISVPLYKALIELAEEYNYAVTVIARQCLEDGVRKYRDLSTGGLDPFRKVPLSRIDPDLAGVRPARRTVLDRVAEQEIRANNFVPKVQEDDEAMFKLPDYVDKFVDSMPPGVLLPSRPPLSETHPESSNDETTE